jgi:hypothetical protein
VQSPNVVKSANPTGGRIVTLARAHKALRRELRVGLAKLNPV